MSNAAAPETATSSNKNQALYTPMDGIIVRVSQRVGGGQAKEVERFIKFAFVGLLGFVIDFGTVFLLQSSFLPPDGPFSEINVAAATTIAFTLAVCSNYIWNRVWTYPDSRSYSIRRQLTQFAIVSIIGGTARAIWNAAAFAFFGTLSTSLVQTVFPAYSPSSLDERKLGTMMAMFVGVIMVMFWNFLANRYWTFNDID